MRYDEALGRFAVSDEVLPMSQFVGERLWAYIDAADAPAVVLARSSNSRLYFHRRAASPPAVVTAGLGVVNNLRCLPPLCLVFPNAMAMPVFRFDGRDQPTRGPDVVLDFTTLEAALLPTELGGIAALVVGRRGGADAVAEVEFTVDGTVLRIVPLSIPAGCSRPNGAVYVPDTQETSR